VTALRNGALPGSGDWVVELLRPGEDPLRGLALPLVTRLEPALSQVDRLSEARKLADRLRSGLLPVGDVLAALRERLQGAPRLLLVFDQFEETFTLCTDEALRRAFLSALLTASETPWCSVLFTLRADFYGRVLEDGALGQRVDAGLVNVLPMNAEEARAAIEQPATNAGRRFEEGLAPRILEELLAEPGNLPLLEFALTALWERQRPDGLLTHAAYGEIGGVSGAIAQRATATLAGLPPAEQQAVRRVFTRLVRVAQPVEGGEDTKRRILLDELDAASQPLVRRLADARLLVTDRDAASGEETVEVAHEALIRGWGELRAWLNSDREFLLWRQRLRTILTTWLEKAQDAGALLRGVLLDEAAAWGQTRQVDLSEQEQAFISASQDLAQRERIEREAARQRELKLERDRVEAERQRAESQALAAQQLRQRAVWLAFALMLAVIVAGVALYYYDRAQRNADLANQKLADFRGEELFNEAQKLKEGELSDASAVQAVVEKLKAAHAADSHPDFDLPAEIENLLRTVATRWVKEGEKLAVTGDLTQAVRWYQAALDLQPPPDTPVYVHVPAGSFRMGSDNGENDEKPQHEIILKEFWILRSEVTNAQYRACVEAGVCEQPESVNWIKTKLAAWPVVNVSWQQAQQYASWKGGRLPTEAEWEKACRGRDGQIYPWGDQPPTPKLANFDYNEGVPVDVGSYPDGASPYGLYDMAGNVWEWTNSLSKDYPYNPQDGREDLEAEGVRTLRGGSFSYSVDCLRCASRLVNYPSNRLFGVGFRLVAPGF
jgi:formylglycine-generating enzyme required for sulfatase activity